LIGSQIVGPVLGRSAGTGDLRGAGPACVQPAADETLIFVCDLVSI
jgi:hypothetical protein